MSHTPNLYVWQDTVKQLTFEDGKVTGVITGLGIQMYAKAVILTAGTFLSGLIHIGKTQFTGGRLSEPSSFGITEQLVSLGFKTDRMKTGTPSRIDVRTIAFSKTTEQPEMRVIISFPTWKTLIISNLSKRVAG